MRFVTKGSAGRERYFIDHKEVAKEEFDRAMADEKSKLPVIEEDPELTGNRPWSKPIESQALAYHPRQVAEARAHYEKHGLPGQLIREDGKVVLPDRATRKRVLKLNNMHDNNGGYGDG